MADREVSIHQVGSYNPNATHSTTNIFNGGATRMGAYFRQLHQEIQDRTTRKIIDDPESGGQELLYTIYFLTFAQTNRVSGLREA